MSRNLAKKIKEKKSKRETIDIGTIGDFVATFTSLRPLEASKNSSTIKVELSNLFQVSHERSQEKCHARAGIGNGGKFF